MKESRYSYFEKTIDPITQQTVVGLPTDNFLSLIDGTETKYTIPIEKRYRPDLIADLFYKNSKFWWVLTYVNKIDNSPEGFYTGREIIIPSLSALNRFSFGSR